MSCPNSDPDFNGVLKHLVAVTPANRRLVFYMVCIFFRFAIYSLVYVVKEKLYAPYIVGGLAAVAVQSLLTGPLPGNQWWSKWFQLAVASAILVTCIARIWYPKEVPAVIMPGLLYVSLFGGLAQSFFVTFC